MRATSSTQLAPRKSKAALGNQPPDGDTELGLAGLADQGAGAELTTRAFDYVSHFANFDSKPLQQQLPLRLNLTKRHFMTPDSNLRLRCSSTQAQLLLAESVTLTIWPTASRSEAGEDFAGQQQSWQQKSVSNQQKIRNKHTLRPSNIDRWKLNGADNGAVTESNAPSLVFMAVSLVFGLVVSLLYLW